MCVCVRMCVRAPRRRGRGRGLVHQTEHWGFVGRWRVFGGRHTGRRRGNRGTCGGLGIFRHALPHQRATIRATFLYITSNAPMSIISPAGTGMGFLFSFFFSPPYHPMLQFQHMALENRHWKNKMRNAEGFVFFFPKGCVYIGLNRDGFFSAT